MIDEEVEVKITHILYYLKLRNSNYLDEGTEVNRESPSSSIIISFLQLKSLQEVKYKCAESSSSFAIKLPESKMIVNTLPYIRFED